MSPHEELFRRLLDESSALLAAPEGAGIVIPDDDLHSEIIVPLLPAMLADAAIRGHWSEQAATGFVARVGRHFENGEPAPRWTPGDFEIHVTASYSAGADARALADTLLSEESLRDMTAALMNQLLDALWPSLAPAPSLPVEPPGKVETIAGDVVPQEITTPAGAPTAAEISEPFISPASVTEQPLETAVEILPPAHELETSQEIQSARQQPSCALVRALGRKLAASVIRRGLAANSAAHGASAAIVARRIFRRATPSRKRKRTGSRTPCLG